MTCRHQGSLSEICWCALQHWQWYLLWVKSDEFGGKPSLSGKQADAKLLDPWSADHIVKSVWIKAWAVSMVCDDTSVEYNFWSSTSSNFQQLSIINIVKQNIYLSSSSWKQATTSVRMHQSWDQWSACTACNSKLAGVHRLDSYRLHRCWQMVTWAQSKVFMVSFTRILLKQWVTQPVENCRGDYWKCKETSAGNTPTMQPSTHLQLSLPLRICCTLPLRICCTKAMFCTLMSEW